MRSACYIASCLIFVVVASWSHADEVLLQLPAAADQELVVAAVDLTAAARWCEISSVDPAGIRGFAVPDGRPVTLQFVPATDFDPVQRLAGTVVLQRPADGRLVRLALNPAATETLDFDGTVRTAAVTVSHDPAKAGGLPSRIEFHQTGKVFDNIVWQDRLYDPDRGVFRLADDRSATVKCVSDGPLCRVVQVAARYVAGDQRSPPSSPSSVYQWFYFRDQPSIYVTATQQQQEALPWREAHFLELHQNGDVFPRFAGSRPEQAGSFTGTQQSYRFDDWAGMFDDRNGVAMGAAGNVLIYDGKGGYGPYLHARGSLAWTPWNEPVRHLDAWLWLGTAADPVAAAGDALHEAPRSSPLVVTVDSVRSKLNELRESASADPVATGWQVALAEQLEAAGRWTEALQIAGGQLPDRCRSLVAGDLNLVLELRDDGIGLLQLYDGATATRLGSDTPLPLFSITLREAATGSDRTVRADQGWKQARIELPAAEGWRLQWQNHASAGLDDLTIRADVKPDRAASALRWTIHVDVPEDRWSVRSVTFPQVAVRRIGDDPQLLFPRAAGEVKRGAWDAAFQYSGTYPTGWTSMQMMAVYDAARRTGLYLAMHDPHAATKDLRVTSRPGLDSVELAFEHPTAQMDVPGNDFELSGQAVWQILRGDWFDAAAIYRRWVLNEAKWAPAVGAEGRTDTPRWMRELPLWALASGPPEAVAQRVEAFADYFQVPVGVHWYNWHQIPFDNDYPHYFPTKAGFAEAVERLQRREIHVMPYINGRLWDTRDHGIEDEQFTRIARPAATKDEAGAPYVETYGSKESDGSPVRLAVMCPTIDVWRTKLDEIVGRLMGDCKVHAVYIDQIAAARPQLCFDRSHGHPTGGGAWWTAAYWDLLSRLNADLPPDRVLTTECNAEAYAHVFDGFLTWHWQYDGQVPVFPAIYGGRIQMFGRAYRGGPSKDLALRMKAGQQLVFGEQIGWIDPGVIHEAENAAFLKQVVQLRWQLRRYFYAGRMARPPRLLSPAPRVTADWQWSGTWPVTTDAVMTGAWTLPEERRAVLLMVNVGDEEFATEIELDLDSCSLPPDGLRLAELPASSSDAPQAIDARFPRPLRLPPRTAIAWELTSSYNGRTQMFRNRTGQ